ESVRALREFGKQLGDAHAGDLRRQRGKWSTEFAGSIGLRIPHVEMGRAAPQPEQYYGTSRAGHGACFSFQSKQVGQRQAENCASADLKKASAGQSLARPLSLLAGKKHDPSPAVR